MDDGHGWLDYGASLFMGSPVNCHVLHVAGGNRPYLSTNLTHRSITPT